MTDATTVSEAHLKGEGISRGIAIGPPFFLRKLDLAHGIEKRQILQHQVEDELIRFHNALNTSRLHISRLKTSLGETNGDAGLILDAQLHLVKDPMLISEIEAGIKKRHINAEAVLCDVLAKYRERFDSLNDPFFHDRFKDLEELARQVIAHLLGTGNSLMGEAPTGAIVFATNLTPSDTVSVRNYTVGAFVTERGGTTSHAAIVAKAKGIPYVANINVQSLPFKLTGPIIVDGRTGIVVFNPTKATLAYYRSVCRDLSNHQEALYQQSGTKTETFDGCPIRLSINLDEVEAIELPDPPPEAGVGLFRSEYLLLSRRNFPTEEEQFHAYRRIVERLKGAPVSIRVFDVGGDKYALPDKGGWRKLNPYLGCRALRFLLKRPDVFRLQIRAILRASALGPVSILLPLVSSLSELREVKGLVQEERANLTNASYKVPSKTRIGSMIEIPSAALIADLIAQECDFLSIGTNDLVQYSLAADRCNHIINGHYNPTHPGVIRLINFTITQANSRNIPVSICGEMASDPRFTALLLGLGIHELSIAPSHLPLIRHVVRQTTIVETRRLANQVLQMTDAKEIIDFLTLDYSKRMPKDLLYNPANPPQKSPLLVQDLHKTQRQFPPD